MSGKNINLQSVTDLQVRDDGEESKITFEGKTGQSLTVTLTSKQLIDFQRQMVELFAVARVNHGLRSDTPKAFSPVREVVLVNSFELEMAQDGSLHFLIESNDKRSLQVSFLPQHGKPLVEILTGLGQKYRTD